MLGIPAPAASQMSPAPSAGYERLKEEKGPSPHLSPSAPSAAPSSSPSAPTGYGTSRESTQRPVNFIISDMKNQADPKSGTDPVPIVTKSDKEIYWEHVTKGRAPPKDKDPVLIIMFGPPGCGKSWVLERFMTTKGKEHGWTYNDFVLLDPDTLRVVSKEYRLSLSGAHAKRLLSVQQEFHGRLVDKDCEFRLGDHTWTEPGCTVGGKHLALSMSAVRSAPIVRQAMLWGYGIEEPTDAFTDRAFQAGSNVIYVTTGIEPNKFLKELMRRARYHHQYKVVVVGVYAPLKQCVDRCEVRGKEHGRFVGERFLKGEFEKMFPKDDNGNDDREAHYNKFMKEVRKDDELYLYDNTTTGALPELIKTHVATQEDQDNALEAQRKVKEKEDRKKMDDDKGTQREQSSAAVKKLSTRLNIYTGERNDACVEYDKLTLAARDKGRSADEQKKILHKLTETQRLIDKKQKQLVELMIELSKEEAYVLVHKAFYTIVERLEDRDPKMRRAAEVALQRMQSVKIELLDDSEQDELVQELKSVPKRLFNNLADGMGYEPKLIDLERRRSLCRMQIVNTCMVREWATRRGSSRATHPKRVKAQTVVEYFERLAELRKQYGSTTRRSRR